MEKRGAQMAALIAKTLSDMMREAQTCGLIDTGKNPVTVTPVPSFEVERSKLTLDQFWLVYERRRKRIRELRVVSSSRY
ncbi:hypothetical protein [Paraburkholderia sp. RAU2J]|uniref:hypothetical protein n=1 Tax=Paraburkholderia sp. RAU2J TaxID=1938810 RepID=UPI0011C3BA5D|nr:hypothetical protein [Paraburkholderia sp. RAU2J]